MIINQVVKGGGTQPTGTKNITANGVYDVTDFASADVQVPTTAPTCYVEKKISDINWIVNGNNIPNLGGAIDIGAQVFYCAYRNATFPANTSIDFSSLTGISGSSACQDMFAGAQNIVSVDLSSLQTISGSSACMEMFSSCNALTSVDVSSLTTLSGGYCLQNAFSGCAALTSFNFSSLTSITGTGALMNIFNGCSNLTTVKLNALSNISVELGASYGVVFNNNTKLERVELGGLKASTFVSKQNQLRYLFSANTGQLATNGCTVHFPSNFDPDNPDKTFDITTLTGYPTFNGNASYIHLAYDLPATE